MAALVGYVQQAWNTSGQATLTLSAMTAPGGGTVSAASGQMAWVEASHASTSSPLPSGWKLAANSLWWKMLDAADITAGSVQVNARLTSLTVLSGAAGFGRYSEQPQVNVRAAGGGAIFRGITERWQSSSLGAGSTYRIGAETTSSEDGHKHAIYWRAASAAGYVDLPGANDDASFRAYEVLAPAAPLAPLLLLPESGSAVNRDATVTLAFAHRSSAGLPQLACRVPIRVAGGTWGSVKPDGTIAAGDTSQVITTAAGEVSIAAGVLAANSSYEWYVLTQDAAGWSPASTTRSLVARVLPTAVVTLTAAFGDRSPVASWVVTPGTGTLQGWQLRISPAADGTADNPIWDSGQIAGAALSLELPASIPWVNGGSYRAWLAPTDSALAGVFHASNSAVVAWTPPSPPSSVAASDGSPPTVTVSGIPGPSESIEVQAGPVGVDDWVALATRLAPGSSVAIGDPLAPYGVARRYRARAWATVSDVLQPSAWVESSPITPTDLGAYLVAADGSAYVAVQVSDAGALVPIQGYSRSGGLGDTVQRVDRTQVAGYRSWWEVETDTPDDEATVIGWLTDPDRPALWLRPHPERPFVGGPIGLAALLTAVETAPAPERWVQAAMTPRRIKWDWITQREGA